LIPSVSGFVQDLIILFVHNGVDALGNRFEHPCKNLVISILDPSRAAAEEKKKKSTFLMSTVTLLASCDEEITALVQDNRNCRA
jgi:hypothetical protein